MQEVNNWCKNSGPGCLFKNEDFSMSQTVTYTIFHNLLSWSYVYHCVWNAITCRISLQTIVDRPAAQTRLHLRLRAFFLGGVHSRRE